MVRRQLWFQKSVWGSVFKGQGVGEMLEKVRIAAPLKWLNAM
jgi:hypothetical protein